jgi:hypothetical protein
MCGNVRCGCKIFSTTSREAMLLIPDTRAVGHQIRRPLRSIWRRNPEVAFSKKLRYIFKKKKSRLSGPKFKKQEAKPIGSQ